MCCRFITKWNRMRSETQFDLNNKFNAYKSELNIQNIYTIHTFIENINVLYEECKQIGYSELLNPIKEFQTIITQKTNELVQFHSIR